MSLRIQLDFEAGEMLIAISEADAARGGDEVAGFVVTRMRQIDFLSALDVLWGNARYIRGELPITIASTRPARRRLDDSGPRAGPPSGGAITN